MAKNREMGRAKDPGPCRGFSESPPTPHQARGLGGPAGAPVPRHPLEPSAEG